MATNLILAHSKFLTRRNLWKDKTARVVIETVPEKQQFESRYILKKNISKKFTRGSQYKSCQLAKIFPHFPTTLD